MTLLLFVLLGGSLPGCSLPRWMMRQQYAVEPSVTKEQLVAHLNKNVLGSETQPPLKAWQSQAKVRVSMLPIGLNASIAVEAPRNLRLLVSNPVGGQEVDLGSNSEQFWIWTKERPQEVMTVKHEEVSYALQALQFPVDIHPDWLMQVFGVIPLDPNDFELVRPKMENGEVELVARRQSRFGEDVERVIKVNLFQGRITEHTLRLPGGMVMARAKIDSYHRLAEGTNLPAKVRLQWPDAGIELSIETRTPQINPASLAQRQDLWEMPSNVAAVDLGALARSRGGAPLPSRMLQGSPTKSQPESQVTPVEHQAEPRLADDWPRTSRAEPREPFDPGPAAASPKPLATPGRTRLSDSNIEAPPPVQAFDWSDGAAATPSNSQSQPPAEESLDAKYEWARGG